MTAQPDIAQLAALLQETTAADGGNPKP